MARIPTFLTTTMALLSTGLPFEVMNAQNLVADGGFENYALCPNNVSCFDGYAADWVSTGWTPDLYNSCGFLGSATTTNNVLPHSGNGMVGMFQYAYYPGLGLYDREHVIGTLTAPLVAGTLYKVEFFAHPVLVDIVDIGMGVGTLGAHFSDSLLGPPPADNLYPVTPQVVNSGAPITDLTGWTKVSGCFIADGGEQYVALGNFEPDASSNSVPLAGATAPYLGYVLVDDVSVEAVNVVDVLRDTTVCDGGLVLLDAATLGIAWTWEDGSTAPTRVVDVSGTYWVDIDLGGCVVRDSCVITIGMAPAIDLGKDTLICSARPLVLSIPDGFDSILWSNGATTSSITVVEPGLWSVEASNACGSASDSVRIDVEECLCEILAPNAFTPNGDGMNDRFMVLSECSPLAELLIFDRWGEVVHRDTGPNPAWDGDDMMAGVYVWKAYDTELHRQRVGSVVLIR